MADQPASRTYAEWLAGRTGAAVVIVVLVLVGWALQHVSAVQATDAKVLDAKFRMLRTLAPLHARDDIVIVGIDEATLAEAPEPIAVWHRPLARTLEALAGAAPRAVAIDIVLPDRSYDAFAPGSDATLLSALLALRRNAPIVLGVTTTADGALRPIHPPFVAAAGRDGVALAMFVTDEDGRVRRYTDRLGEDGEAVPTLSGVLAASHGVQAEPGLVQFALGDGFDYVAAREVLRLAASRDSQRLDALFRGKTVLLGFVLPHDDRQTVPVPLARWEDRTDVPGVLLHAQMLRTALAGATVHASPLAEGVLLLLAATLWLVSSWRWRVLALLGLALAAFVVALVLLRHGTELPLAASGRVALFAVAARSGLEAWRVRADRTRLRALFGGYVSPGVLQEILTGQIQGMHPRRYPALCFLFVDLEGFTGFSERLPSREVVAILNRYFDAVTPVVHEHGGTLDNFRGDGLLAIFGAPNAIAAPANACILAARAMFARLQTLNRMLVAEGQAPLAIRATMAMGEAVVGNVGANDRYNFTAIGDAVNVAARLQDVAKAAGCQVVATRSLVTTATGPAAAGWTPLGCRDIRGHSAVDVCGWTPPD